MINKLKKTKKNTEIGQRLRLIREELSLTTYAVGEIFDVNNGTVSRWETGKSDPPLDYLCYLADKSKCDLNWIFFGDNNANNAESITVSERKISEKQPMSEVELLRENRELRLRIEQLEKELRKN